MTTFKTGDGSQEAVLFVTLSMVIPDWFRIAFMGALREMTVQSNWFVEGDATADFARDKSVEMINSIQFSEENPLPINKPYTGEIRLFAFTAPPDGWLRCDGQFLLKATYPDLYAKVLNYFGSDTSTHFYIPDMRGRFPVASLDGTPYPLGDTGGQASVTLDVTQIPAHTHNVGRGNPTGANPSFTAANVQNFISNQATSSTGGGQSHENRPPYMSLMFCIYTGVE